MVMLAISSILWLAPTHIEGLHGPELAEVHVIHVG
jgi:hypothetical protein